MNNKLSCIIVEDEIPSAQELEYIISQYKDIKVDGIATNGEEGIKLVKSKKPNAVFLDINMPLKNGIELAKEIKNIDSSMDIIFITAYEEYAIEAFKLYALDYILKPFNEKRIEITLDRLRNKWKDKLGGMESLPEIINEIMNKLDRERKLAKRIPCYKNGKIVFIDIEDIFFCYIKDEKTYVKTARERYFIGSTLCQIEEKTNFFRAHRSYLVNMNNIKEMYSWFNGTYKLVMNDKEKSEIPISRNNVKKLREYFKI
ncbi:LytR/AlgR family response regulator transcription factor [Clostridium sp. LBM24168]